MYSIKKTIFSCSLKAFQWLQIHVHIYIYIDKDTCVCVYSTTYFWNHGEHVLMFRKAWKESNGPEEDYITPSQAKSIVSWQGFDRWLCVRKSTRRFATAAVTRRSTERARKSTTGGSKCRFHQLMLNHANWVCSLCNWASYDKLRLLVEVEQCSHSCTLGASVHEQSRRRYQRSYHNKIFTIHGVGSTPRMSLLELCMDWPSLEALASVRQLPIQLLAEKVFSVWCLQNSRLE